MFEKSRKIAAGETDQGDSRLESLTVQRTEASDAAMSRLRTLSPELAAAIMQVAGSAFDSNEARAEESIELATQIVNGMTVPEIYTLEGWQLHMRQCNALDALEEYRKAREELGKAVEYLTRRCLRMLGNQLATGAISKDVIADDVETVSAAG